MGATASTHFKADTCVPHAILSNQPQHVGTACCHKIFRCLTGKNSLQLDLAPEEAMQHRIQLPGYVVSSH
ncbi:hypothetical protein B7P43_G04108 [Cryptotermes secundus]|uniref:Uncharacterized protein n=1 Tax=Cryptotermes secundus TaxID=105785 RepID=A0A2J7R3U9_9NEOP|nr:hypothetical protein B7P43_G04108 [Cryptotermes secundus]